MKSASSIAKHISPVSLPAQAVRPPVQIDQATASVVNKLFAELKAIFPAWRQAWPDDRAESAAKRSWVIGFMDAGITRIEQIKFGVQQCRREGTDFAPSVGKFVAWCRPTAEMLGLPCEDKAFAEAVRKTHPAMAGATWSHDAVYHAAAESGFYNLQTLQQDASRKLFARNYAIALRMVLAGEPLKAMPLALPAAATAPRTAEVGNAALAGLRALRSRPASG